METNWKEIASQLQQTADSLLNEMAMNETYSSYKRVRPLEIALNLYHEAYRDSLSEPEE